MGEIRLAAADGEFVLAKAFVREDFGDGHAGIVRETEREGKEQD
jgi:hypothetical protein